MTRPKGCTCAYRAWYVRITDPACPVHEPPEPPPRRGCGEYVPSENEGVSEMDEPILWHRLANGAATHAVPRTEFWHGTDDPAKVTCPICLAQTTPRVAESRDTSERESRG